MLALRFYIDKAIDAKTGHGGEHSRIIDVGELNHTKAHAIVAKQLEKDEVVNQVASITIDDPAAHPVL